MFGSSNRDNLFSIYAICSNFFRYSILCLSIKFFIFLHDLFAFNNGVPAVTQYFSYADPLMVYVYARLSNSQIQQFSILFIEFTNGHAVLAQLSYCASPEGVIEFLLILHCHVLLDKKTRKHDTHSAELICDIQWLQLNLFELLKKIPDYKTEILIYQKIQMIGRAH